MRQTSALVAKYSAMTESFRPPNGTLPASAIRAVRTTPVTGEIVPPSSPKKDDDLTARLHAEAREAELRAAEARERAERARSADTGR